MEQVEEDFALEGEASPADLETYQRCSNSMRRLLEAVGLERRARDVTPSTLDQYLAFKARQKEEQLDEEAEVE